MSVKLEIEIAKKQIMYSIAVATLGLYLAMQDIGNPWTLAYIPIFIIMWFLGCIYLRIVIEKREREE